MGENLDLNSKLNNLYYNIEEPSSFRSINALYERIKKDNPKVKKSQIREWLLDQEVHAIHRHLKKFNRNPIISKTIDHIWFADLLEIVEYKKNRGVRFLLMIIDNLSKYGFVRKLKRKFMENITDAFEDIIVSSDRKPKILITDSGPEFANRIFGEFLQKNGIKHVILGKNRKASVVERWIQTIKRIVYAYSHQNNTLNFINVIDTIVETYNNTVHSRTKFKPIDVKPSNQRKVFQNLYKIRIPLEKQSFEVGNRVLIPIEIDDKTRFAKKMKNRFDPEVHIIDQVLFSSPYYKYLVRNNNGVLNKNSFYGKEMIKLTK